MADGVIPSREAVTRSYTSRVCSPSILLVAGRVPQFGKLLQPGQQLRRINVQFIRVRIFQRVLKLRAADAILHGQILHRLHV